MDQTADVVLRFRAKKHAKHGWELSSRERRLPFVVDICDFADIQSAAKNDGMPPFGRAGDRKAFA